MVVVVVVVVAKVFLLFQLFAVIVKNRGLGLIFQKDAHVEIKYNDLLLAKTTTKK